MIALPVIIIHTIADLFRVRPELFTPADITPTLFLPSKYLSPLTLEYIIVPLCYAFTILFPNWTLSSNLIPVPSCSIVDFMTTNLIALHDYSGVHSTSMLSTLPYHTSNQLVQGSCRSWLNSASFRCTTHRYYITYFSTVCANDRPLPPHSGTPVWISPSLLLL